MERSVERAARLVVATACVIFMTVQVPAAPAQDSLDALLDAGDEPAESPDVAEPPSAAEADEERPPRDSEPRRPRLLEEIVVTARKMEQDIRDVPMSMSVIDHQFIKQQNITDLHELALYTPNAHVDEAGGLFPDVNIRGFGSPLTNKAFEQSVGLVVDGIPYGRPHYFAGPLFDLDRVEVLRGPQGTLFGRNTTAGLMNVVTRRPTDELTGALSVDLGELNRRRFEGAIGGPVVPGLLNVRVAGISDERDGLIRNTTAAVRAEANDRMNSRDRKAFRVQLGLPDVLGSKINVGYERVEMEAFGVGWELDRVPEQVRPFFLQFDPNTDFDRKNFVGSVDAPEFERNKIDTLVADARYDLGAWRIDGVAGYSFLTVRNLFDNDFGPMPMLFNRSVDDNPQTTAEVRLNSPSLPGFLGLDRVFGLDVGSTRLTTGFFYQNRGIDDSALSINFNIPVLAQFVAFSEQPPEASTLPVNQVLGSLADAGVFDMGLGNEETTMFFNQTTNSFAGFAQLDWELVDRWTLEYGMRFTHEAKKADWNRVTTEGTGVLFPLLGGGDFTARRSRSESAFTPKVALRHDWTDEVNVYATWGTGFKAGGFNEIAFDDSDDALAYKPETTTAWELGTKTRLFGGAAAVNLGLFRQTMKDFQVLTLPPLSVATTVVNAGGALSQGVELDAQWLPTPWLTMFGTLGFNDTKFTEFLFGQCSFDREGDSEIEGRCDHTGRPMFRTPKWITTLAGNVRFPMSGLLNPSTFPLFSVAGLDLIGGGTFEYQDVQFLERTYDPRVRQSPFVRLGANVGFGNEAQGWSAKLSVQNLTNEATANVIRDVPLAGKVFARRPEPPRLVFGSFQWSF